MALVLTVTAGSQTSFISFLKNAVTFWRSTNVIILTVALLCDTINTHINNTALLGSYPNLNLFLRIILSQHLSYSLF